MRKKLVNINIACTWVSIPLKYRKNVMRIGFSLSPHHWLFLSRCKIDHPRFTGLPPLHGLLQLLPLHCLVRQGPAKHQQSWYIDPTCGYLCSKSWKIWSWNYRCKSMSITLPIGSMHAIYGDIYHPYTPNVSTYTIHGSYGLYDILTYLWCDLGKWKTTLADVLWAIFCNQIINSTDICGRKFSIVSWHVGTDIPSLKQAWKRKMTLCFIKFHYHGCFI